jgi:hypothetical protein
MTYYVHVVSVLTSVSYTSILSGADTDIAKKLACDNYGMFYSVADGSDLSEVMSSYYSYFAASISYVGARWILYDDFATGEQIRHSLS